MAKKFFAPIKNEDEVTKLLSYLRKNNTHAYFLSRLILHTGESLSKLSMLKKKDLVSDNGYRYENRANHIFYKFDAADCVLFKSFCQEREHVFCTDTGKPMTLYELSRSLAQIEIPWGLIVNKSVLIKTFAYHYFLNKPVFKDSGLYIAGRTKKEICEYFDIDELEYDRLSKERVPLFQKDPSDILIELKRERDRLDRMIDYLQESPDLGRDRQFERVLAYLNRFYK